MQYLFGVLEDRQEISNGASRRQARGGNANYCRAALNDTAHGQNSRKPLYALHVSSTTASSAHPHRTVAPAVYRSLPREGGSRGPNPTSYWCGRIVQAYEDGRTLEFITRANCNSRSAYVNDNHLHTLYSED